MPRVVPRTLSELDDEEDERAATISVASDLTSSVVCERLIVVANQLSVFARRRPDGRGWVFSWNSASSFICTLAGGFLLISNSSAVDLSRFDSL
jgi:trehalose 6-phosphate synthase/phosphatase